PLAGDTTGILRIARRSSRPFYDFAGLHAFKAKLGPNDWAPIHLSFPPRQSAVRSFADVLAAFAGGGLVRFAVRSLLRGPSGVVRAFALLLVPWTVLLALAPAEPWFGSAVAKWAWVAFDVLLAFALFFALRRPSRLHFGALAAAVSLDALLTWVHTLVVHSGRSHAALAIGVLVVACTAPAVAALVLWGATRRASAP
ncbi:MAG TPA: hypothetical protein VFG69_00380, partial [Nannocystaceae bacterium]|nr:hypothetical protein [Nannocystaceae bacterium]